MIIMFQVNSLVKTTHRNDTIYSMDACRLTTAERTVCGVYSAKSAFKWSWINLNKWCTDYYYNRPSFAVSYHTPFVSCTIDKTSTVHLTNMIIVDRWYFSFDVDLSLISLLGEDFFFWFVLFVHLFRCQNLILILMGNYLVHFSFGSFDFRFELYLNSFKHRLWILRDFFT